MKKTKFRYKGSYFSYVLMYTFYFACMGVFTSVLSMYLTGVGKSKAEMSFIVSASSLFGVVMVPLVGYISDRLRRPKVIVAVLLAGIAGFSLLFAQTRSTAALYLLNGCISGMVSAVSPISERLAGSGRYRYGTVRIWGTFGYAASAQLACVLMEFTSPQLIFVMASASALLAILGIAGMEDIRYNEEPEEEQNTGKNRFSFLRQPMFLLFLAISGTFIGVSGLNMTYSPILLQELGVPTSAVGTVLFVGTILELPLILFSNKFMDKFSGKALTSVDFIIMIVQFLLYSFAPNAAVAVVTVLFLRAIGSTLFMMIMLKMVQSIVRENVVSTAMGFQNAFNALVSILLQNLGGQLVEATSIRTLYLAMTALAAVGFVLSLFLKVKNTKAVFS